MAQAALVTERNRYYPLPGEGLLSIACNLLTLAKQNTNPAYAEIGDTTMVRTPQEARPSDTNKVLLRFFHAQDVKRRIEMAYNTNTKYKVLIPEFVQARIAKAGTEKMQARVAIDIAERWAQLLDQKILTGRLFDKNAADCYHQANIHSIIDQWIYNYAVYTLAHGWQHGKRLLEWNLQFVQNPKGHYEQGEELPLFAPPEILKRWYGPTPL